MSAHRRLPDLAPKGAEGRSLTRSRPTGDEVYHHEVLGYTRHPWLVKLIRRRSVKIAAIALTNKIARIAWAMMARIGVSLWILAQPIVA